MYNPDLLSPSISSEPNSELLVIDYDDTYNLSHKTGPQLNLPLLAIIIYWISKNKNIRIVTQRKAGDYTKHLMDAVLSKFPVASLTLEYGINELEKIITAMKSTTTIEVDTYFDRLNPEFGYKLIKEIELKAKETYKKLEGKGLTEMDLPEDQNYQDFCMFVKTAIRSLNPEQKFKISDKEYNLEEYQIANKGKKLQLTPLSSAYKKNIYVEDLLAMIQVAEELPGFIPIHYDKQDREYKWLKRLAFAVGFDEEINLLLKAKQIPNNIDYKHFAILIYLSYVANSEYYELISELKSKVYSAIRQNLLPISPVLKEILFQQIDSISFDENKEAKDDAELEKETLDLSSYLKTGDSTAIQRSISSGNVDLTHFDGNGETYLDVAMKKGDILPVIMSGKLLAVSGYINGKGQTLLHLFLININRFPAEKVKDNFLLIFDKGADVNHQDKMGNLAIHYLDKDKLLPKRESLYAEIIVILVNKNINLLVKNNVGYAAFQTVAEVLGELSKNLTLSQELNAIYLICQALVAIKGKKIFTAEFKAQFKKCYSENTALFNRYLQHNLVDKDNHYYLKQFASLIDLKNLSMPELLVVFSNNDALDKREARILRWKAWGLLKKEEQPSEQQQRYLEMLNNAAKTVLAVELHHVLMIKNNKQNNNIAKWEINNDIVPLLLYCKYNEIPIVVIAKWDLVKSVSLIANPNRDTEAIHYCSEQYQKLGISFSIITEVCPLTKNHTYYDELVKFDKDNIAIGKSLEAKLTKGNSNNQIFQDTIVNTAEYNKQLEIANNKTANILRSSFYKEEGEQYKKANLYAKQQLLAIKNLFFTNNIVYITADLAAVNALNNDEDVRAILNVKFTAFEFLIHDDMYKKILSKLGVLDKLYQVLSLKDFKGTRDWPLYIYLHQDQTLDAEQKKARFNLKKHFYAAIKDGVIKIPKALEEWIAVKLNFDFSLIGRIYFWHSNNQQVPITGSTKAKENIIPIGDENKEKSTMEPT